MNPVIGACLAVTLLVFYVLLSVRPVAIAVSPRVAFAPASVRVTVTVQPNAENRGLYVDASGYRSSFVQLNGEQAPITTYIEWKAVPPGDYTVSADVVSNTQTLGHAATTLRVLGDP